VRVGDVRLQATEQVHAADALVGGVAAEGDRDVDVGAAPHEALRHHADDGALRPVEPQRAPDDVGVAGEARVPEPIAEDDDGGGRTLDITRGERATDERRHAHHLEGIGRPVVAAQAVRLGAVHPQHVADRRGDDALEDGVPFGDLEELIDRVTGPAEGLTGTGDAHAHEPVHVPVWERVEHHRVDDAVDGGGRHHAQRQRQHRHCRRAGVAQQRSNGEAKVPEHPRPPAMSDSNGSGRETNWGSGRFTDGRLALLCVCTSPRKRWSPTVGLRRLRR